MDKFIKNLIEGNNFPPKGSVTFTSSDHVRFQNNQDISGHNYGANRRYTVTMFNLDGMHPLWQNNIQMSPKRMRITNVSDNIVQLRGYGYDSMGASFADYGVVLLIENEEIIRVQLNMYDRNISIVYLK